MARRHHRQSPYMCPRCAAVLHCLVRSPADHFCFACYVVVTVIDERQCLVTRPPEPGWVGEAEEVALDSLVLHP